MAGHQYALALREEVPNQVANRVGLARAGWPLHKDSPHRLSTLGDVDLFSLFRTPEDEISIPYENVVSAINRLSRPNP